jgi:hypothetical protein
LERELNGDLSKDWDIEVPVYEKVYQSQQTLFNRNNGGDS